ncbi:hypothetical protein OBBRIDRAFT_601344 [Obba rivulosa]|uniref:Uncharacterized protein n=1 Tax=Obba rivulosa TaxID=1052685 RepID=A0A8E2B313_9APHY|nr:hypothetical protein OBBRIDRAFT_601344 [Obba rivulosa]
MQEPSSISASQSAVFSILSSQLVLMASGYTQTLPLHDENLRVYDATICITAHRCRRLIICFYLPPSSLVLILSRLKRGGGLAFHLHVSEMTTGSNPHRPKL